jgi:pseudouridine-5'-phosphate glycosidase
MHPPIDPSPEVAAALAAGHAVVALETTIVTHGMPYPDNVATARAVEAEVRAGGAVPATIAVLDGRIRVGLAADELERLARTADVMKLSRADLPYALATGRPGATTVAATMICAHLAGIRVFATGGVGGVHRGAETTMDISADLDELARTPVAVVCAGAKAVLDLPKTLEALETRGVPVIGYRTDELPAFWSRGGGGLKAPLRLDRPEEIAAMLRAQRALGYPGGALIANPPPEDAAIPADEVASWIEAALGDAARLGVAGKAATPFLLDRILHLSGGRSLAANAALVRSNARLAAEIAVALA